jgi:hypothetical protein
VTTTAYCFMPAKAKHKGHKATAAKKHAPRFQQPRPLTVITAGAGLTPLTQATTSVNTAPCPPKRRVISGGFSAPLPAGSSWASFNGAHYAPVIWNVSAQQFGTAATPLVAYEDCA